MLGLGFGGLVAALIAGFQPRGLVVKVALDHDGAPAGMIQALPIEQTFVDGRDLLMVLCIWVHGRTEGVGNRQHSGLGSALLRALEAESQRSDRYRGLAAWGLAVPMWMRADWYLRHGFQRAQRQGMMRLVYKAFDEDVVPPRWIPPGPARNHRTTRWW